MPIRGVCADDGGKGARSEDGPFLGRKWAKNSGPSGQKNATFDYFIAMDTLMYPPTYILNSNQLNR